MGSNFGDLDNDGYQDCYIGTGDPYMATLVPNRRFRNADGNFFQDVTTSGGFGHLQKGHGVAFGDIDHDGDQDVFSVIGGAFTGDVYQNVLFANPGHGKHWIKLPARGQAYQSVRHWNTRKDKREHRTWQPRHLFHGDQRGQFWSLQSAMRNRSRTG